MDEQYDQQKHVQAIEEGVAAEATSAAAREQAARASGNKDDQVRLRLDEIYDGLSEVKAEVGAINDRIPTTPLEPIAIRLVDTLASALRTIGAAADEAASAAQQAADEILAFMRDNNSQATIETVTVAIIELDGLDTPSSYADAVFRRTAAVVLEPGRNLPHRMEALERARKVLAGVRVVANVECRAEAASARSMCATTSMASTEALRDVSHLTTLVLGVSPAFADAMRMQSDALAHSLAAFNKVGDMQRQDALGLAIAARAAVTEFDRS